MSTVKIQHYTQELERETMYQEVFGTRSSFAFNTFGILEVGDKITVTDTLNEDKGKEKKGVILGWKGTSLPLSVLVAVKDGVGLVEFTGGWVDLVLESRIQWESLDLSVFKAYMEVHIPEYCDKTKEPKEILQNTVAIYMENSVTGNLNPLLNLLGLTSTRQTGAKERYHGAKERCQAMGEEPSPVFHPHPAQQPPQQPMGYGFQPGFNPRAPMQQPPFLYPQQPPQQPINYGMPPMAHQQPLQHPAFMQGGPFFEGTNNPPMQPPQQPPQRPAYGQYPQPPQNPSQQPMSESSEESFGVVPEIKHPEEPKQREEKQSAGFSRRKKPDTAFKPQFKQRSDAEQTEPKLKEQQS